MRAYKLTVTHGKLLATRYASTAADVKVKRQELMEQFNVKKSAVEFEEVEILLAKDDLLKFINDLCQNCDAQ